MYIWNRMNIHNTYVIHGHECRLVYIINMNFSLLFNIFQEKNISYV